jgi:hypothetical protein
MAHENSTSELAGEAPRRDPNILYLDWVARLNNPPAGQLPRDVYREMLDGFISSREYRRRFGAN